MEEIIKKAIDGGYLNIENGSWEFKDEGLRTFRPKDDAFISYRSKYELILDPRFWQALGKACGWGVLVCMNCRVAGWSKEKECGNCNKGGIGIKTDDWKTVALRFHEINLTEGWEKAVEYLISLINEE